MPTDWFSAPGYWLTREILERLLGAIYLFAFFAVVHQFRPLLGENGLLPVPEYRRYVHFRDAPSLFHWRYSDRLAVGIGWVGVVLSASIVLGLAQSAPTPLTMLVWFLLWILYLSIVNVGQRWYSFGWESLLLEAGFLAIFLGDDRIAPPFLILILFRWLAFRVEFGAGLIKLRGDPCWRDLTCLDYHHETQPMPNPLSWYFHHLPRPLHRVEVLGNFFAQLVAPFGLFLPQPTAAVAGAMIVLTQAWLVLSGNFSWLNLLTMALAFSAFDDRTLSLFLSVGVPQLSPLPSWWQWLVVGVSVLVVVLSYRPVRNLISSRQLMNFSFDPFHLVNTYGAFGSVTKERYEIVIEGTAGIEQGEEGWRAYEFKGKPGDPHAVPRQYAPYHLRLDWLMWFAAMEPPFRHQWLIAFLVKLLPGDRATSRLLRHDPFRSRAPVAVRANLYHYRFSTWRELRQQRAWWVRTLVGEYLPPLVLDKSGSPARL